MSSIRKITVKKPESHDEIIAAIRKALEIAYDVELIGVTINLKISPNTGCTLSATSCE